MIKNKLITITLGLLLYSNNLSITYSKTPDAITENKPSIDSTIDQLQPIINDYTAYIATIPAEICEEVRKYRREIVEINNKKRELYKRLSQEAQNYFIKEQKYKKRLTLNKKNQAINQQHTTSPESKSDANIDQLQPIINEYSAYITTIPVAIREEIRDYRIKIVKINSQKRELYKKISQEAQNYLTKEQEYKKRLSLKIKKVL